MADHHRTSKLFLVGTMLVLLGAFFCVPVAGSPLGGTDISSAPTLEPGIYTGEYRSGVILYYNVSGKVGANLTVTITWAGDNCSDLHIDAPNGTHLAAGMAPTCDSGIASVSIICDSNLLYTIRVVDPAAVKGLGDVGYTLIICLDGDCGQSSGGIPGFPLFYASLGTLMLLGLMKIYCKRME